MCQCLWDKVTPPPAPSTLPPGLAQKRWDEIGNFDCCSYKNSELGCPCCCCCSDGSFCKECTCVPKFFPQAVSGTCFLFGDINHQLFREQPMCCPCVPCCFGPKGCSSCLILAPFVLFGGLPPGAPIAFSCFGACLTVFQRRKIYETYSLDQSAHRDSNLGTCQVFCCYPCSLWKHYVFVSEMMAHSAETSSAAQQAVQRPPVQPAMQPKDYTTQA